MLILIGDDLFPLTVEELEFEESDDLSESFSHSFPLFIKGLSSCIVETLLPLKPANKSVNLFPMEEVVDEGPELFF